MKNRHSAQELAESWVNGNLSWVIDELDQLTIKSPMAAVYQAYQVGQLLGTDRAAYGRALCLAAEREAEAQVGRI